MSAVAREFPALLDRDLSWLEFNKRVLHEAMDDRTPLLERVKFLAIFGSNLDEFFMKRIGVLTRAHAGEGASLRSGSKVPTVTSRCFARKFWP